MAERRNRNNIKSIFYKVYVHNRRNKVVEYFKPNYYRIMLEKLVYNLE